MLNKEQDYILNIGKMLGYEPEILHHDIPTRSCAEKLDLLKRNPEFKDWTLDRIIKVLYFSENGLPFIGVITPEFGRIADQKDIFSRALKMSRTKAAKYWVRPENVPTGMTWGTCTPFPYEKSMISEISNIIFLNHPPIRNKLVDISLGGTTKEMFQTSMHIPYIAIYDILKEKFWGKIHLINIT